MGSVPKKVNGVMKKTILVCREYIEVFQRMNKYFSEFV